MGKLNRRDFMRHSAGALAATWTAPSLAAGAEGATAPAKPAASLRKALGKTGLTPTLLGVGTGTKAWNGSSVQNRQGREPFVKTLCHGYERGLRYYDMADMYGAHEYLKDAMKQARMPREELVLLTKSVAKDAAAMKADLDRFRKELDTDYLDIVLMHCMQKADWPDAMRPCMEVLSEAKEKGVIRAKGISCHHLDALNAAADSGWVDVMLSRINPFGIKMDGPAKSVVPVLKRAHERGKGILGMKILGEGQAADKIAASLKFVLALDCVDAITIGFLKPEEIDDAIAHIEATV